MPDYTLYYWPVPFRGQFVRATLAYAGKRWSEKDAAGISELLRAPAGKMPIPCMGPPLLLDRQADAAIAQMPAILLYLGETLGLLPAEPALKALSLKTVNDANDVIDELTLDGGRQLWTKARWKAFLPRLRRWMEIWEETGTRHRLTENAGHYLGTELPGIADIATATLWSTMGERFPGIETMLRQTAPRTAALAGRVSGLPALARLAAKSRKLYGEAYCGGEIEASLRKVQ